MHDAIRDVGEGESPSHMQSDLIALPSMANVFQAVGTSSQTTFNEFIPIALFGLGIGLGALILLFLTTNLWWAVKDLFGNSGKKIGWDAGTRHGGGAFGNPEGEFYTYR
jgi:hypothetical protein